MLAVSSLNGAKCIYSVHLSGPIFQTHHVYHFIENITVCSIKIHALAQLWNGGGGGGSTKHPPPRIQYISLDAQKRVISMVSVAQSANR